MTTIRFSLSRYNIIYCSINITRDISFFLYILLPCWNSGAATTHKICPSLCCLVSKLELCALHDTSFLNENSPECFFFSPTAESQCFLEGHCPVLAQCYRALCRQVANVRRGRSEVRKILKFNECGTSFSVKIESGPMLLTFTLIWCWVECRDSYFTSNKSSGRKKKRESWVHSLDCVWSCLGRRPLRDP